MPPMSLDSKDQTMTFDSPDFGVACSCEMTEMDAREKLGSSVRANILFDIFFKKIINQLINCSNLITLLTPALLSSQALPQFPSLPHLLLPQTHLKRAMAYQAAEKRGTAL